MKLIPPLLFTLVAFALAIGISINSTCSTIQRTPASGPSTITIKTDERYQFIEGWGTSLAWWANALGGWEEKNLDTLIESIFGKTGLEMNIVRYNIGGGDHPLHHHMRYGADIPGFKPTADGPYNWSADKNQIRVLQLAKRKGANIFEAFSNSAPYWMTQSECAAGNGWGYSNNLREDMYDDFANYIADVVQYFKTNYQINFASISPINEPSSGWWTKNHDQEGSHYDRPHQEKMFQELAIALRKRNLRSIIAGPEEWSLDETNGSYQSYSNETKKILGRINTHTYSGSNRHGLRNTAWNNGQQSKVLWVSEYGMGGVTNHDHSSIDGAIGLVKKISADIQELGASGWVYWQAVENEGTWNDWGLIHAPFQGEQVFWKTKQYWALAHFSKHVPNNSQSIGYYGPREENGLSGSAFLRPDGKIAIIFANNGNEPRQIQITFKNSNSNWAPTFSLYLTNEQYNYQFMGKISSDYIIPPKAIITVISN